MLKLNAEVGEYKMTDLDRLLKLEREMKRHQMNHDIEMAMELKEEYDALKSKIEQDLKYWQKYKDETREVEHIITKRNSELSHIKTKIKELEQQIKELQEEVEASNNILDIYKKWGDGLTQKLEKIEAWAFRYVLCDLPDLMNKDELKAILEKSQ